MNKGKPFARPSPFPFSARKYASSLLCQALPFKKTFFRFRRPGTKSIRRFPPLSAVCSPRNLFLFPLAGSKKRRHQSNQRKNFYSFSVPAQIENTSLSRRLSLSENGRFYLRRGFSRCGGLHFPRSRCGFPFRRPHAFLLSFRFPSSDGAKRQFLLPAS